MPLPVPILESPRPAPSVTPISATDTTDSTELDNISGITIIVDGQIYPARLAADGITFLFSTEEITPYMTYATVHTIEIYDRNPIGINLPISALVNASGAVVNLELISDFGTVFIPVATLLNYQRLYGDTLELFIQSNPNRMFEVQMNGISDYYPLFISIPLILAAGTTTKGYVAVMYNNSYSIIPYSIFNPGGNRTYQRGSNFVPNNHEIVLRAESSGIFGTVYNARYFNDNGGHWAISDITFVASRELFNGIGNNTFAPEAPMTRGMFAQAIANIYGVDLSPFAINSRFSDVEVGAWYAPAIEWAAGTGKLQGIGGGMFAPEEYITREQMATMLNNYAIYRGHALPSAQTIVFTDNASISQWAYAAVRTMHEAGVIQGRPNGSFEPQVIATRAEAAAAFARFIDVYVGYSVYLATASNHNPLSNNSHSTEVYAIARDEYYDYAPPEDDDNDDDTTPDPQESPDHVLTMEELDEYVFAEDGTLYREYR